MALDRETIDAQDIGQDFGEFALGGRHRVRAPVLSHRTHDGPGRSLLGKGVFHGSSAHEAGKNELITVWSPCRRARSLTSLLIARSSTPSPNGLNTVNSEPFLATARPL